MNHKKLVLMGIWVGLIAGFAAMGWELPLQQVSHPECKGVHWQELSESCKIALDAPMEKSMSELLTSVLWGASYNDPHTPGGGGHPSVDWVSTVGTPVYSIGDGEVITAKYTSGYGNAITIRHSYQGETIFSNYSHLSVMNVRPGQRVEQGMKIGEVGRSGFTMGPYGYHLDFQITTIDSPSHPYGYHDCSEGSYLDVVNQGLCKDKLEAYTIDPLEFFALNTSKDIRPVGWRSDSILSENETEDQTVDQKTDEVEIPGEAQDEVKQEEQLLTISNNETQKQGVYTQQGQQGTLEDTIVIRRPDISDTPPQTVVTTVQEHSVAYEDPMSPSTVSMKPGFDIEWEVIGSEHNAGAIIPVQFIITQDGEPVSGKLADRVTISESESITVLPGSFSRIFRGKKTVFIRTENAGSYRLDVKSGETQLGQIVFTVE